MKVIVKKFNPIAYWKWNLDPSKPNQAGQRAEEGTEEEDEEEDVCGICRIGFEGCCTDCKSPGDDCPLIWGECSHVFHMHCLLKWISQDASKQACPMDRRPWVTASGHAR